MPLMVVAASVECCMTCLFVSVIGRLIENGFVESGCDRGHDGRGH